MTDTSTNTPTAPTAPPANDRLARFEADLEAIGHRTSRGDRKWALGGIVAMLLGIALTAVAYAASTSQSDTRDVISSVVLATVGLSVVVAGAAVFLRSSITEFLRFWMLRLLYEQQADREDRR